MGDFTSQENAKLVIWVSAASVITEIKSYIFCCVAVLFLHILMSNWVENRRNSKEHRVNLPFIHPSIHPSMAAEQM